ncbi:MAG: glycosyl hydrolase 2 galactose-binding domain-containing protein, partial [Bacteroidota bacterium]
MKRKNLFLFMIMLSSSLISGSIFAQAQDLIQKDRYINQDWELFSSTKLNDGGEVISTNEFEPAEKYQVELPATVLAGLRQNGLYPDIYYDKAIEEIDGSRFEVPWWYRKELVIKESGKDAFHQVILEGTNYKAELWINGQRVAEEDTMEGAFGIHR